MRGMKKMITFAFCKINNNVLNKNRMKKLLTFITLLFAVLQLNAVPAKKGQWKKVKLSDGTEVRVQLKGDENAHWWETEKGETYVLETGKKYYKKVEKDSLLKCAAVRRKQADKRRIDRRKTLAPGGIAHYTGTKKGLVILVEFKNKSFAEGNNLELYKKILNKEGFNEGNFKGSVKDYFKSQSQNTFELDFDVAGPVILKNDYSYYGGNDSSGDDKHPGAMVAEACKGVDSTIDFSQYDWDGDGEVEQVYVVYAGQGEANGGSEDTVWPHEWGLAYNDYGSVLTLDGVTINTYACGAELGGEEEIDGIGTFCHEFSHCLGFPDMYDTRSNGDNFGMGTWDLMDYGSYNDDGFVPSEYTSYEKWAAGWLEPIVLADEEMEVTNMKALSEGGEAYVIYNKAISDEFYLLENRQLTGWDAAQYGNGLLVLHVDYDANVWANNKVNTVATRQRCTIFHADNSDAFTVSGLRNDPYPSGANDSLTNKSVPAATLYNANDNGKKYMNVSITSIKRNGDGTMSFNYKPITPSQGNYLFRETFDDCNGTGGNDGSWSGSVASSTFNPDNDGWTALNSKYYGGKQCAKFGTGSVKGTATTPEFTVNGTATFTFKAAPFGSDGTTLTLSTNNSNVTISPTTFTMKSNQWTDFTATLTGTGNVKVTFTPAKRLFLDEILAEDPATTAIKELPMERKLIDDGRIYTIDGRFVGTDFSILKKGIYIINGKKIIK